jgi:hypothetical protein
MHNVKNIITNVNNGNGNSFNQLFPKPTIKKKKPPFEAGYVIPLLSPI